MEKAIIQAIKTALPSMSVYHDFAPDNAVAPFAVIQRVGGAGNLYLDNAADAGYHVRFQVSCWTAERLEAVECSRAVERALLGLPATTAEGAATAAYDIETGLRGMRQDFLIIG